MVLSFATARFVTMVNRDKNTITRETIEDFFNNETNFQTNENEFSIAVGLFDLT